MTKFNIGLGILCLNWGIWVGLLFRMTPVARAGFALGVMMALLSAGMIVGLLSEAKR